MAEAKKKEEDAKKKEDDDAAHKRAERLLSECGAYAAKLITELRSAGLASSTRHGALCAGEMVSADLVTCSARS